MPLSPDDLIETLVNKMQKQIRRAKNADKLARDHRKEAEETFQEVVRLKKTDLFPVTAESANPHYEAYKNFGESKLAMMLFMDIVDFSQVDSDGDQKAVIETLNMIVLQALAHCGADIDDVVCLPSGDGMCLCFTDHTKPLRVAEAIQLSIREAGEDIKLRMGIHSGGVLRVSDLKGWYNLAGDAINMTQRAMDYGDAHHILCTKTAYDLLTKMKGIKDLLNCLGECEVKHGVPLELFSYVCAKKKVGNIELPRKSALRSATK